MTDRLLLQLWSTSMLSTERCTCWTILDSAADRSARAAPLPSLSCRRSGSTPPQAAPPTVPEFFDTCASLPSIALRVNLDFHLQPHFSMCPSRCLCRTRGRHFSLLQLFIVPLSIASFSFFRHTVSPSKEHSRISPHTAVGSTAWQTHA